MTMSKMVHDLDKRAAARDSLFAMQALSSGLRLATSSNLDRRLFAADKIQDPDKRQKTTQTLLNLPAANTPTSELSTAAQSECPLRSAAAQKALRDRAARRTKERDDVVNGTHMCLRPAHAEHLDNHLTDLYKLVTDNWRPVFGVSASSRQVTTANSASTLSTRVWACQGPSQDKQRELPS